MSNKIKDAVIQNADFNSGMEPEPLKRFRLEHISGKIQKRILQFAEQVAVVEARIYLDKDDAEDSFVANAFAQCCFSGEGEQAADSLELAETAAVVRALVDAGFSPQVASGTSEDAAGVSGAGQSDPDETGDDAAPITMAAPPASANPKGKGIPYQPAATLPTYTAETPVDEILSMMTLDEAKNILVTVGARKGQTLGQIAVDSPKDIKWYAESYRGPNNILRAGAALLINVAMAEAG